MRDTLQPKPSLIRSWNDQAFKYRLPMWDTYTPAWVEALRRAGYPTKVLVIDFETYFDDDMPESTIEYVTCPAFEILSCTFTLMSGEYPFADYEQHTQFHAGPEPIQAHLRYLQGQFGSDLSGVTVVAQNAAFDLTILAKHFGITPAFVVDILGLARHLNSRQKNDLGHLCEQHSLPPKGDTSQFKGLTFRNRIRKPKGRSKNKLPLPVPKITAEQLTALAGYNTNDNLREWELFTLMLPQISNPHLELRTMQLTLELFTKPMLHVDYAKGDELVAIYEGEIDKAVAAVGCTREDISGNLSFDRLMTTALEQAGENVLSFTKFGKKGAMLALAKQDEERSVLLEHPNDRVRGLMNARVAIKSWPLHVKRVRRIMAQARANGGVLPVPLKYHGAHTGRDSGGEKINLQNMPSRGNPVLTAIRNLLIAPPTFALVIVDAAQVEARGCDWIAGQQDSLDRWARNEDQYANFASVVVGYKVRKPTKLDPPPIAKRLKWARDSIGKVGVLGCGYGMGGDKAEAYAQRAIDNATAHKVVAKYRETHAQVVQFWRDVEKSFAYTARYQRPSSLPRGLRFDPYNEVGVILTLPNGRELRYPRVKLVPDTYGDKIEVYNAMEHKWEHTWGGTLTENIVQAFCRDILMEAMLRLDAQGLRTVHRIHDELVICVPEDQGQQALKLAEAEMSKTPTWAPGLPLGAEGKLSRMYCK